jgi:hypothetical protein
MSKKVLFLGIVILLLVGAGATYLWVDYSQAQNSLIRSRLEVRILGEHLDRHQDTPARLMELYRTAKLQVDMLEQYHATWIDKQELAALRTALEKDEQDIQRLSGAAGK